MTIMSLLNPKSVAIVGASPDPHKPSGMALQFLAKSGYKGAVYPINPKYPTIGQWTCYPSLAALPGIADLVVVATPTEGAMPVLEECAKLGTPAALVMSGGFGEGGTGAEGDQRRDRLAELVAKSSLRVLGPNTVGMVNFSDGVPLTFADWYGRDLGLRDKVAILTHSGSTGGLIFSLLQGAGVGVNYWVGLGNEIDLEAADFIQHFADADDVNTVVCFLEGLKDGVRFIEAVRHLRAVGKNVVVLKAGRSVAGQRSTLSHTGKLSSSAKVYDAVFSEIGVIQAAALSEIVYLVKLLRTRKRVGSGKNTVGIISASGGICSIISDHADDNGLDLPILSKGVQDDLKKVIPDFGSPVNPVDTSANVISREAILTGTLDVLKSNTEVATWVLFGRPILDRYHRQIAGYAPQFEAELVACSGVGITPETAASLKEGGVTLLEDPELCMRALGRLAKHDAQAKAASVVEPGAKDRGKLRRTLGKNVSVGPRIYEAFQKHKVPSPLSYFVASLDEARSLTGQNKLKYPVAVKSASDAIPHKTEAGCVELGINSAEELHAAVTRVVANSRKAAPKAPVVVEIQEMVKGTNELLITITQDRDFGPIAVVGLGGITTELLADAVILTFPASSDRLIAALKRLKGWPLLAGYRGRPAVDLKGVARLWDAVSALYLKEGWIGELELNPVIVGAPGGDALAVDALVTIAE